MYFKTLARGSSDTNALIVKPKPAIFTRGIIAVNKFLITVAKKYCLEFFHVFLKQKTIFLIILLIIFIMITKKVYWLYYINYHYYNNLNQYILFLIQYYHLLYQYIYYLNFIFISYFNRIIVDFNLF